MKSLKQKVDQLEGLIDTTDVSDWENGFLKNIAQMVHSCNGSTARLTERQVEILDRIWGKHFA